MCSGTNYASRHHELQVKQINKAESNQSEKRPTSRTGCTWHIFNVRHSWLLKHDFMVRLNVYCVTLELARGIELARISPCTWYSRQWSSSTVSLYLSLNLSWRNLWTMEVLPTWPAPKTQTRYRASSASVPMATEELRQLRKKRESRKKDERRRPNMGGICVTWTQSIHKQWNN